MFKDWNLRVCFHHLLRAKVNPITVNKRLVFVEFELNL